MTERETLIQKAKDFLSANNVTTEGGKHDREDGTCLTSSDVLADFHLAQSSEITADERIDILPTFRRLVERQSAMIADLTAERDRLREWVNELICAEWNNGAIRAAWQPPAEYEGRVFKLLDGNGSIGSYHKTPYEETLF